jgi:hypothetical protein
MPMPNTEQLQETDSYHKKEEDLDKELMNLSPFAMVSSI